jgi:hypothetical protein
MIFGQKSVKSRLCGKIHRLLRQRSENPERLADPHVSASEKLSEGASAFLANLGGDPLHHGDSQRPYAFLFDE